MFDKKKSEIEFDLDKLYQYLNEIVHELKAIADELNQLRISYDLNNPVETFENENA